MMLTDLQVWALFDDYCDFVHALTWYRMYCVGRLGKNRGDYKKGFEMLKEEYDTLRYFWANDKFEWSDRQVDRMLQEIQAILEYRRFGEEEIAQIANLLWKFEVEEESQFRERYFDKRLALEASYEYSNGLYRAIGNLLDEREHDEAVVTAFKYFDHYLQQLLGVPSHKFFGEKLINYAFAPQTGKLQLGGSENEQKGLRNFISGANALFRNPAAHKFVLSENDDFEAQAIVAMVALMIKICKRITKSNLRDTGSA